MGKERSGEKKRKRKEEEREGEMKKEIGTRKKEEGKWK